MAESLMPFDDLNQLIHSRDSRESPRERRKFLEDWAKNWGLCPIKLARAVQEEKRRRRERSKRLFCN